MKTVHVSVCCHSPSGPAIHSTTIKCTEEQFQNGTHYDWAKAEADDIGYDGPMVAFDEYDEIPSRLIAAAPDLLAIAKMVQQGMAVGMCLETWAELRDKLDDVIGKATGENLQKSP